MSDLIEAVAKAMWDERRANANNSGVFLEFWGDGSIPKANGIMDEARAAVLTVKAYLVDSRRDTGSAISVLTSALASDQRGSGA